MIFNETQLKALKHNSIRMVTGKDTAIAPGGIDLNGVMKSLIVGAIRNDVMVTIVGGIQFIKCISMANGEVSYRSLPMVMAALGKRDFTPGQIIADQKKLLTAVMEQQLIGPHIMQGTLSAMAGTDIEVFAVAGITHLYDPTAHMVSHQSIGWILEDHECAICHSSRAKITIHEPFEMAKYLTFLDELGNLKELDQETREMQLAAAIHEIEQRNRRMN